MVIQGFAMEGSATVKVELHGLRWDALCCRTREGAPMEAQFQLERWHSSSRIHSGIYFRYGNSNELSSQKAKAVLPKFYFALVSKNKK
jgi:hypothetical protein